MTRLFDASIIGVRLGNAGTAGFAVKTQTYCFQQRALFTSIKVFTKGLSIRETRAG